MHPIHDVDVILLLALALASKRRPAELAEIVAAAELGQEGAIPSAQKLVEAFSRLSSHGLIREEGACYGLTPEAEKIMAGGPRQADRARRIFGVKEKLSAYTPQGEHASILVTEAQLTAAIQVFRASGTGAGRNLLLPKPKVEEKKRPWFRGRPDAGRGRKA